MLGEFWQDLRYGARILLKSPVYTAIAIVALALSIGANTAVFSAVNTLLLRPLPLEDLDRLVFSVALREGFDPFGSSLLEFEAYQQRNHSFENIGAAMQRSFNLIGRGEPERIRGASIMADYLATLGVKPVLGRSLTLEEDQPGGPAVALIGYGFWQKHFGGNTRVIVESRRSQLHRHRSDASGFRSSRGGRNLVAAANKDRQFAIHGPRRPWL